MYAKLCGVAPIALQVSEGLKCLHMDVDLSVEQLVEVVRCCGASNARADHGNPRQMAVLQALRAEQGRSGLLARSVRC